MENVVLRILAMGDSIRKDLIKENRSRRIFIHGDLSSENWTLEDVSNLIYLL